MLRTLFVVMFVVMLSGCSTMSEIYKDATYKYDVPKCSFESGTRIGIINLLKPTAIHRNIKALSAKDTFEKECDVDWDIDGYITKLLISELNNDGRYDTKLIAEIRDPLIKYQDGMRFPDMTGQRGFSHGVESEVGAFLDRMAIKHNVDVIIVISEHFLLQGTSFFVNGYGLITTQGASDTIAKLLGTKQAFVAIGIKVFKSDPTTYIGGAKPSQLISVSMKWPSDIHNIPQSDFNKLKPLIETEINKIVNDVLENTNLIQIKQ